MSLDPPGSRPCTRGMANSDPATQEWTLASVRPGDLVDVLDVLAEDPEALLVHGIRPGVRLAVEGDAPFGGPRIVRFGNCRVAIDRRLTRLVRVARVAPTTAPAPAGRR